MENRGENIIVSHSCQRFLFVKWTVTGKVSDVIRTNGSSKPDLHFDYDAMGQRIAKTVTNKNTTDGTDKFVTTYYMRDPRGNVLAVYEHKHGDSGNGTFTLTEQHLYGSSRLGMKKRDLALNVANASEPTPVTHYELTNHLGNVMAVISDEASTTDEPTVVSLSDYYPYGMTEPGRSYTRPGDDYRFGYTGHEKENDLAEGVYTTEYRLLDTRLGRWMSVDPLFGKYAGMSPYNYCMGNPVMMVDPDGCAYQKKDGDAEEIAKCFAMIAATKEGAKVMTALIKADKTYYVDEEFFMSSNAYDPHDRSIYIAHPFFDDLGKYSMDRDLKGSTNFMLCMAHESYHAYQHNSFIGDVEHLLIAKYRTEPEAVSFANYIRSVYKMFPLRNKYNSKITGNCFQFSKESQVEQIIDFKELSHDKENKNFSFSYTQKIKKGRWEKQGGRGFEFDSFVPEKNENGEDLYDEKKYYMIVSYDKNDNMTYKTFDNEEDYKKAKNW